MILYKALLCYKEISLAKYPGSRGVPNNCAIEGCKVSFSKNNGL